MTPTGTPLATTSPYGPAMAALTPKRRRLVLAMFEHGDDETPDADRPDVKAATQEEARRRMELMLTPPR